MTPVLKAWTGRGLWWPVSRHCVQKSEFDDNGVGWEDDGIWVAVMLLTWRVWLLFRLVLLVLLLYDDLVWLFDELFRRKDELKELSDRDELNGWEEWEL